MNDYIEKTLADTQELQTASTIQAENTKNNRFTIRYWRRLLKTFRGSLRQKFSELTISQWLYLIAALLLFVSVDQDVEADSSLIWVGTIAGIGLMRELWHVFNRLWENILGKGLVLVLYAATANFAIAIASLKVNAITGVEPSPFIFAIGFTTLLMLPFWMLVSSIVFFSVALIVSNMWLILSVLLRLIRIKVQVHWEDKSFVFATMVLRVILIPYVIMSVFFVAVPFAEQIEILDNPISQIRQAIQEQEESDAASPDSLAEFIPQLEGSPESLKSPAITVTVEPNVARLLSSENSFGKGIFDTLIGNFIYYFETYPKSACKKTEQQRSLMIDENIVLLVEKDDSELGYHFFVAPCEGDFSESNVQ